MTKKIVEVVGLLEKIVSKKAEIVEVRMASIPADHAL